MKLLAGNANVALASAISAYLEVPLIDARIRRAPAGLPRLLPILDMLGRIESLDPVLQSQPSWSQI